jgi:hypothetical protein
MRGSGIAKIAGVATKAKILNYRNQQLLESLRFLLKERKKIKNT